MTALRSINSSGQPRLSMVIEPENKFRFRYASESGSHGGIPGKKNANVTGKVKKVYPTVKLENYHSKKPVVIRASLCTEDREPHVLELVGKHIREDGMCYEDLDKECTAKFSNLVIRNKKKEDAHKILMERKICSLGRSTCASSKRKLEKSFENEIKEKAKEILSSAVLYFEAFTHDNLVEPICPPIYSESIYNQKSSLRIHRMSRCSGSWKGDEEIILLCDKVKKDAIKVLFFERDDDDSIVWESEGAFSPADVHHQVAITFKTPKYKEDTERTVFVCLSQNDEKSDSVEFRYTAGNDDLMGPLKKRKRSTTTELENLQLLNILEAMSASSSSNEASSENLMSNVSVPLQNENISNFYSSELIAAQSSIIEKETSSESFMSNACVPPPIENSPNLYSPELNATQSSIVEQGPETDSIIDPNISEAIESLNYHGLFESEEDMNTFLDMNASSLNSYFSDVAIWDPDVNIVDSPSNANCMQTDSTDSSRPFYIPECDGFLPQSMFKMSIKDKDLPTKKRFHYFNDDPVYGQMEEGRTYTDAEFAINNLKQLPTEQMIEENKGKDYHFKRGLAVGQMAVFEIVSNTEKGAKPMEKSRSDLSDKVKAQQVCLKLLSKTDDKGNTLLHLAVLHKKNIKNILKMIKFSQADILNAQNHNKQTAIHLATLQNNAEVVKLLCLNGAKPDVKNSIGDNCFHVAARNISINCLRVLNICCAPGSDDFNYEGLTPLHIIVMKKPTDNVARCVECLTLLLEFVDVNVKDKKAGRTPLHYAVEIESAFVSDLLQQSDIDVNSQDFSGDTPLHVACTLGYLPIAKLLLENGADPLIRNFKHSYPVSDEESSEDETSDYQTTEISTNKPENTVENTTINGQTPLDVSTDKQIIKLLKEVIQRQSINTKELPSDYPNDDADQLLKSVEEKMCHSLDDHLNMDDWSSVVMCLGMDDSVVDNILNYSKSPANAVVQNYLKRHYKENYIEVLQNAFEMAGLQNALKIVKEIHSI